MDEVILSALARDKPVAAKRVKALADENAQLRGELYFAQRVVDRARKWAAHDDALADALRDFQEAKK